MYSVPFFTERTIAASMWSSSVYSMRRETKTTKVCVAIAHINVLLIFPVNISVALKLSFVINARNTLNPVR